MTVKPTVPIPVCRKCKAPHINRFGGQACAGHKKSTGEACTNHPSKGATVCKYHGGAAPQVRAVADRRITEAAAARELAALGLPVDVSPSEALLEEVRWTAGHVRWIRLKLQDLGVGHEHLNGTHPLVWGETKIVEKEATKHPGTDTTSEAGVTVWYEMYLKERQHLVAASTAALRAGVEERRVALAEQQGDLVADVIQAILADLHLSASQQALVSTVVPARLLELTQGA